MAGWQAPRSDNRTDAGRPPREARLDWEILMTTEFESFRDDLYESDL
jgi:hypothetical protein